MSIGCPVIASNISSIPEVVGDAGLYIDPESLDDMKKQLIHMLTDDLVRDKFIKKGYEKSGKFSWDKCAAEHYEYYKELLSK